LVSEADSIRFMAVGDVNVQRLDPLSLFGPTVDILASADVLIGNQEGVLSDRGTPLLGKKEVGSSCVRASCDSPPGLARIGFSAMSMANNHGMDFGPEALAHSLDLLHENGIATAGAGATLSAAHAPAIITRHGVRIAMLAYTSVFPAFGFMATPDGAGLAVVRVSTAYETPSNVPYQPGTPSTTVTIPHVDDTRAMREDVRLAKLDADLVVVQFHWGVVGMSRPLGYMRELGRTAVDAGADLVIGNHAHVLQGVEFYRDKLICYSLNHFAFEHVGHIFPEAWPFVHDTVIFAAAIEDNQFARPAFVAATLDPITHDLALASDQRRAEVAEHLTRLSAEFGTVIELDGDRLTIRPPTEPTVPLRAPDVYRDPSSVVLDGQGVLARAARARATAAR
jgi:poly-gamma-glutamate capsule biosynthesis protein CapA/YwtB (metallophosphatase superfamily)